MKIDRIKSEEVTALPTHRVLIDRRGGAVVLGFCVL
jgi:hypothetical protein